MAGPWEQYQKAPESGPWAQYQQQAESTAADLVTTGIQEPEMMPDIPEQLLGRLPEDPAQFAASLERPNAEWVQRQYDRKRAAEMGGVETFVASAGKGGINLLRGLGLMDMPQERERQRWEAAQSVSPGTTLAGEITGEAIPFLAPAGAIGQIASTPARVAAAGALGGAEAGISARGRTGSETEALQSGGLGVLLGAGLEAAIPYIGRALGSTYRKLTGKAEPSRVLDDLGRPTPEVQKVLDEAGISYDEITDQAMRQLQDLPPQTSPEQAARMAAFTQEGVPFTRGDISQQLADQATEARLIESAADPLADPFRARRLEQSEAIRSQLEQVAQGGVPERAGEATKEALSGRLGQMKSERRALYQSAKQQAAKAGGIPVQPEGIMSAFPGDDIADIAITAPKQAKALDDLLIKYGLKEAPEGFSGEITPLAVDNAERFRKSLNAIERGDDTKAITVATSPLKRALDDELDLMTDAGVDIPKGLQDTLKQARAAVRAEKTEFSPDVIVGRLVMNKKTGAAPIIEASQVVPKLLGRSTTKEDMLRTMQSLAKAGEPGKQAIGDLQAAAVMQIMNDAFGAATRKIDGIPTFGPGAYKKALDKIGKDKLNILFSGNSAGLKKLNNIGEIAKLIQPTGGAVPKGSATANLEIANRLMGMTLGAKFPIIGDVIGGMISTAKNASQTSRSVAEALAANPDQLRLAADIDRAYPALSQAIGIAGVSQAQTQNQ